VALDKKFAQVKKKLAVVIPRYGAEINGGAEVHARLIIERLRDQYEIEVLTTTSRDSQVWQDYFPEGETFENGSLIRRFRIAPRSKTHWLDTLEAQAPEMFAYATLRADDYDVFLIFGYLFYPANALMQIVGKKSVFVPLAHDEPALYVPNVEQTFQHAAMIAYNSNAEKRLVETIFPSVAQVPNSICGVGFDLPDISGNENAKNHQSYIVYAGRIVEGKGCKTLIRFFSYFRKKFSPNLKLYMIGESTMGVISAAGVYATGFISETEKQSIMAHATAFVMPSKLESLSMATLEAMALGLPVLVNGESAVLRDHVRDSYSGFAFTNRREFCENLSAILALDADERQAMLKRARRYVQKNYSWQSVMQKIRAALEFAEARG